MFLNKTNLKACLVYRPLIVLLHMNSTHILLKLNCSLFGHLKKLN